MIKYFEYLDGLRESRVTNMFGAGTYLEQYFGIERARARKIAVQWMETFDPDKTVEERVAACQSQL